MAAKPAILTVDDDPHVLRAIERDLRRQYGTQYRVMRTDSGAGALDLLRRLEDRGDPVAMLIADQRMPEMTGVEFLEQAVTLVPSAKRVLLTAYADTEAAIRAINSARIHHYLIKPWDPPEQNLYPFLTDLLADWQSHFRAPFEGIRVVGTRWSRRSHAIRDFLGRNLIPFLWLDVDVAPEARAFLDAASTPGEAPRLPLVVLPDGEVLSDPEPLEVAARLGLAIRAEKPFYDMVVVGGGPAGLAAAVYGASEGLHTLLVEREAPGGQAGTSSNIENYLGFPVGLTGADLTRRAVAQAHKFGAELLTLQDVQRVSVDGPYRLVTMSDGSQLSSHVLVVATGVEYRELDVPGAKELTGRGIYYGAALTEAISCRDEDVYLVGGGNSAGQAAAYFANYARRVTLLVRGPSLSATMSQYLIERILSAANIEVQARTEVIAVSGESRLETITLRCADGQHSTVPATSLFVFIGAAPRTDRLGDVVQRDDRGFIRTGPDLLRESGAIPGWTLDRDPYLLETNVPGIFAAGDVRHESVKRVASAVGEGSIAVQFTHNYLART